MPTPWSGERGDQAPCPHHAPGTAKIPHPRHQLCVQRVLEEQQLPVTPSLDEEAALPVQPAQRWTATAKLRHVVHHALRSLDGQHLQTVGEVQQGVALHEVFKGPACSARNAWARALNGAGESRT